MSAERRGSGPQALLVVVAVVVVLLAGLWFVDRQVHRRVEATVATDLQPRLGTPEVPQVVIGGYPFLTQLAGQRFDSVHVVADRLGESTDARLIIRHADLELTGVSSTDWFKTLNADRVAGTAEVSYDQLKTLVTAPITYAGNGRFSIVASSTLVSLPVAATVTGGLGLNVDDQTVSLTDPTLVVAGYTVPDNVAEILIKSVVKPTPVNGLPYDLKLTGLTAADDGLHVVVGGENVALAR